MATLSQGPRLNARTTARIHRAIKTVGIQASIRGLQFQGRDVTSEAIISSVLLEFLKLSQEDQTEFLRHALKELQTELEAIPTKTSLNASP